jgi:hypothetical protein
VLLQGADKPGAAKVREKSNAVKDLVNTVCIQQVKIVGRIAGLSRGARGLKLLSGFRVMEEVAARRASIGMSDTVCHCLKSSLFPNACCIVSSAPALI